MGGKSWLQKATLAATWAMVAVAGNATVLLPDGFATTGHGYAEWYWLSSPGHARWEFLSIPSGAEPYLAVETFLCLPASAGAFPSQIQARFALAGSAGGPPQAWLARLDRVQVNGTYALYFGQLFIPRRTVGSRLVVTLNGAELGFPVGVHPYSVRVAAAVGGGAITPPAAPASGPTAAPSSSTDSVRRLLPPCESLESAPFLSPGTYQGALGWAGPGTVPAGKGVYRVNLRAGQIVSVRVEAGGPCRLVLLDPSGRPVGEIEGSSWLGLEYRAAATGAWGIVVVCTNGGPRFDYTLTLEVR